MAFEVRKLPAAQQARVDQLRIELAEACGKRAEFEHLMLADLSVDDMLKLQTLRGAEMIIADKLVSELLRHDDEAA